MEFCTFRKLHAFWAPLQRTADGQIEEFSMSTYTSCVWLTQGSQASSAGHRDHPTIKFKTQILLSLWTSIVVNCRCDKYRLFVWRMFNVLYTVLSRYEHYMHRPQKPHPKLVSALTISMCHRHFCICIINEHFRYKFHDRINAVYSFSWMTANQAHRIVRTKQCHTISVLFIVQFELTV